MEDDADAEDEWEVQPSRAIPPVYLLRCPERCPECGTVFHVYALAAAAFYDGYDDDTFADFTLLTHIRSLPASVTDLLKRHCPSFRFGSQEGMEVQEMLNHCACGAMLNDHDTQGDVGAAFFPISTFEARNIKLYRLPIDEPFPLECSWSIGIGDVLGSDQAEAV